VRVIDVAGSFEGAVPLDALVRSVSAAYAARSAAVDWPAGGD